MAAINNMIRKYGAIEVLNKYDCSELIKLIKCIYLRKKKRLEEGKRLWQLMKNT